MKRKRISLYLLRIMKQSIGCILLRMYLSKITVFAATFFTLVWFNRNNRNNMRINIITMGNLGSQSPETK